jgi:tetratricopeptide (TPR) repeat protein
MSDFADVVRLQASVRKSGSLVLAGTIVVILGLVLATAQASRETRRAAEQSRVANEARIAAETAEVEAAKARTQADDFRKQIASLREALGASRIAITAFHQGDFATALKYYDAALRADPDNAYLLNLRAYALFKERKYEDALAAETQSIRADPDYAWGYFDLARFQCAVGKKDEARQAIAKALALRPDLRTTMRDDGEFRRLCGNITP